MDKKISKIIVDRNLCIGAASCVIAAGDVFELDAENKAIIKLKNGAKNSGPTDKSNLENDAAQDSTIIAAAQSCPTKAITIVADDGSNIYP